MNDILVLKNVQKKYKETAVVKDLSLNIKKGEVFALLGANGAGKTTTIKMILGLAKASSGDIEIEDGAKIGYSPETPYFPEYLTAMEVMNYYAGIEGDKAKKDKAYLRSLLEVTGLEDSKVKVKNYSKGMIQRLALAQALISDPDILILDEPTAGLDALGRKHNLELLKKLKEQGKTVIINSHILHDIEAVCDRGVIMRKGEVLDTWTKDESDESLEDKFIRLVGEE
ncbi:ABC transporter ATP-binding protein [Butyrivibrio sp. DSM 10294]|jgi:ABC-2 type transport system ATP-binding protein|uniref:ABC transporter ATP-binding protein n=1 Tax=Butyrivibrio sp. DSM 10294 TaxID=2972457 RepID=UPI00234E9963|nr:ABC transporter ATP-binding protein [Butyrivibrio sp. DSM 10294]MDC7293333.1 ABC transporter ATP-binding protein [Butyrivibrio sp. DSM 10294]